MLAVCHSNVLGSGLVDDELRGIVLCRILGQVGVLQRYVVPALNIKLRPYQRMFVARVDPVGGVGGIAAVILGREVHGITLHVHCGYGQLHLIRLEIVLRDLQGGGAIGAINIILYQSAGVAHRNGGGRLLHTNLTAVCNRLVVRHIRVLQFNGVLTHRLNLATGYPHIIFLFNPGDGQRIAIQNDFRLIRILNHRQVHITLGNLEISLYGTVGVNGTVGHIVISTAVRIIHRVTGSRLIHNQLLFVFQSGLAARSIHSRERNLIAVILVHDKRIRGNAVRINGHIRGINTAVAVIIGKVGNTGAGIFSLQGYHSLRGVIVTERNHLQKTLPRRGGIADRQIRRIGLIQQQTADRNGVGNAFALLQIYQRVTNIILCVVHNALRPYGGQQSVGIADLITLGGMNGNVTRIPTGTV